MDDESHREEMNAAIRAQRERGAVPRSMLPAEDEPGEESPPSQPSEPSAPSEWPAPPAKTGLIGRLFGR